MGPPYPTSRDLYAELRAVTPDSLKPLLADDWAAVDPELPALLEMLFARSAGEDWHKAGTFKDHLLGVCRTLTLWNQPREVRLLGLSHSAAAKLVRFLLEVDAPAGRLRLALTHEEIGQLIGASRETVTRLLNDFRRKRLIDVSGDTLTVRDRAALEALALARC